MPISIYYINKCCCLFPNDTDPEDDFSQLHEPNKDEEIKDGQWMGVTVRSQGVGGKVSCLTMQFFP